MATQITAGKILRRGVESLGNDAMVYLLKNKEQVQRINDDFDDRRTALIEQHTATQAEIAKLEEKETGLVAAQASLDETKESIKADRDAADAEHNSAMDALTRRTREVVAQETAAQERDEALDTRENEKEGYFRTRETELSAREETVEARETAADEREQELHNRDAGAAAREKRIRDTAEKMTRQAATGLG